MNNYTDEVLYITQSLNILSMIYMINLL